MTESTRATRERERSVRGSSAIRGLMEPPQPGDKLFRQTKLNRRGPFELQDGAFRIRSRHWIGQELP